MARPAIPVPTNFRMDTARRNRWLTGGGLALLAVLVLVVWPLVGRGDSPTYVAQQLLNGLFLGSVYALFAVGYTLVFGVLDILNLAHAGIFAVGGMVAWWLVNDGGWNIVAALIAATLVAGLLGIVLDRVAFRRLRQRGAGQLAPLISSIGMALIFQGLLQAKFGPDNLAYPAGAIPRTAWVIAGLRIQPVQLLELVVALVLMVALNWLVRRTAFGRQMRAVAENPRTAALLGINIDLVIIGTFFLASALGGTAGVLYGMSLNSVELAMGAKVELKGLAVIILGGMGSIPGAVLGGFLLGLIEAGTAAFFAPQLRDAAAFTLLFLMLLVRPGGLFGAGSGRVG
jgi:branched-chain amino acid transport system permease protein